MSIKAPNRKGKTLVCVVSIILSCMFIANLNQTSSIGSIVIWHVDIGGNGDFISIQSAIDASSNDDIIIIHGGRYNESIIVEKSLDIWANHSDDVTICGLEQDYNVLIKGNQCSMINITVERESASGVCYQIEADKISLDNCMAVGGESGFLMTSCSASIMNRCWSFNNSKYGCRITNSDEISIMGLSGEINLHGISVSYTNQISIINSSLSRSSGNGIKSLGVNGIEVIGSTFFDNGYDVSIVDSQRIDLGNNIHENSSYGLRVSNSKDFCISNTKIHSRNSGLVLNDVVNVTLESNNFDNCGFEFEYIAHETMDLSIDEFNTINGYPILYYEEMIGTEVTGSYGQVILVRCADMTLHNLTFPLTNNGIKIYESQNVSVVDCKIQNSLVGIIYYDSEESTIRSSEISACDAGIIIDYSDDIIIEDCTLSNNTIGIEIKSYSERTSCMQNEISDNEYGIVVKSSEKPIIDNNLIQRNQYGINGQFCWQGLFYNNLLIDNVWGLYLQYVDQKGASHLGSTNNTIRLNDFYENTIALEFETYCNDNRIYLNSFINNSISSQITIDNGMRSHWNISKIGNHWSNWTSPDEDKNGIVDRPYPTSNRADVFDYYPLTDINHTDYDRDGYMNDLEEKYQSDMFSIDSIPPDLDEDLIPDDEDDDRDGDGHRNDEDEFPDDPDKWQNETISEDRLWITITIVVTILVIIVLACVLIIFYLKKPGKGEEDDEVEGRRDEYL